MWLPVRLLLQAVMVLGCPFPRSERLASRQLRTLPVAREGLWPFSLEGLFWVLL